MNGVYLDHISLAVGERCLSIEESAAAGLLTSRAEDLRAAGFERHWLAADATSAYDLAVRAVEGIAAPLDDVELLLYSTALPCNAALASDRDFAHHGDVRALMDFPASRLQAHFGLDRAAVIGVGQQACTGLLGSLRIARSMLATEPALGPALCVTADRFPPGARYEQAYNAISDGASACMLSREARGYRLVASHHITNGALAVATDDQTAGAFFSYMHRLVVETCAVARITAGDLRWIVTQNTYRPAWQVLASLLAIDAAAFYSPSMAEYGHIIGSDCLANLACLEDDERLARGDLVLLVMAGYGSNWQALLLERA